MKIFISQPMRDKTNDEIKHERETVINTLKKKYGNVEIVDSFMEGAPHEAKPLWFLGKSLQYLSQADGAYFCDGWRNARGCLIEHTCAANYGIEILND